MWTGFAAHAAAAVTLAMVTSIASPAGATTYTDPTPSWMPNGRVYAMGSDDSRIYIGGSFSRVRNPATRRWVNRAGLAAFDAVTGELDTSWNPGTDGRVRALAVAEDVVYVGGDFTSAGGAAATRLAAIDKETGAAVAGFASSPNREVRDLVVLDDSLFVAGRFSRVDGRSRVGVAKVDAATGALDLAWNARVGRGRVVALAPDPQRGQLVIGGNFKRLAGAEHWYLGAVSYTTGAADADWTPQRVCDTCNVLDVDVDAIDVFAAVAGGGGGRAVAYHTTGDARRWVKRGDGDVQAIDYHDGMVYAGGHFGPEFDGLVRHQVAVLDAVTGAVQQFAIPFTGNDKPGVWALEAEDTALRIGGGFQGIEGVWGARYAVFPAMAESASP